MGFFFFGFSLNANMHNDNLGALLSNKENKTGGKLRALRMHGILHRLPNERRPNPTRRSIGLCQRVAKTVSLPCCGPGLVSGPQPQRCAYLIVRSSSWLLFFFFFVPPHGCPSAFKKEEYDPSVVAAGAGPPPLAPRRLSTSVALSFSRRTPQAPAAIPLFFAR